MPETSPSAGVDVGLRWLDLGFYPFVKPIRAPNSDQGIETIIAALRERGAVKVALEAIGGYGRKLVAALRSEIAALPAAPIGNSPQARRRR